jgi:hypothetical protein
MKYFFILFFFLACRTGGGRVIQYHGGNDSSSELKIKRDTETVTDLKTAESLETIVNKFMIDSVIKEFTDSASYTFVSLRSDTIDGGHSDKYVLKTSYESIKQLEKQKAKVISGSLTDTSKLSKLVSQIDEGIRYSQKLIDDIKLHPTKSDSIIQINILLKYKVKQKAGNSILGSTKLIYYPKEKRLVQEVEGE